MKLLCDKSFLHLASVEWFTEVACNQLQLKVLNSFNKITKKWQNKLENYQKFQNFYGCSLKLGIQINEEQSCWGGIKPKKEADGKKIRIGLKPNIFRFTSEKYNFKPYLLELVNEYIRPEVHFHMFRSTSIYGRLLHMSTPFVEIHDVVIATPGDFYGSYEKLLLPFDDMTWKLLHFTFLVAFFAIFIINMLPKFIQNRVYGENNKHPALNVVSTFFGIAQFKLPIRSIPRFILIVFVFFCLIFRTCYQSKLFEFLTSSPRHPSPKTIKDLKDGSYTLYTTSSPEYLGKLLKNEEHIW